MELTQEYFDQGLANLLEKVATKADIKDMVVKSDIKDMVVKSDIKDMVVKSDIKDMATKADIADLKAYVHQGMEIQQEWMDERFKELIIAYDVRERVTKIERELQELKFHRPVHVA